MKQVGNCLLLTRGWTRKSSYEGVANWSHRISTMRVFNRYLDDIGTPAYIPPKGIVRKVSRYNAHLFISLYADKTKGILTKKRFLKLTDIMEKEQKSNQNRMQEISATNLSGIH